MGTKYTTTAVVGYNSTPPADDGTALDANKIKWSTIKTKLPDPLNTAIASIDSKLVDYVNVGPVAKTTTYTTVAGDHNKTLECSGTFTVSLMDASSAGAGYTVEINNQGTGTITVGRATAGDTINTVAGNVTLAPKVSKTFRVITTANGYAIVAAGGDLGTAALVNTGTSGATIPLLNAANTWSAAQTYSSVSITGGSISGITDLAVADGGTGASTAADARTNLGLGTAATVNTGTSGATIPLLNAANTFADGQVIYSSDAGAGEVVGLTLYRASASPAANDYGVSIRFAFIDSAGAYTGTTGFRPILLDPTNGSEDTGIDVITYAAGTVIGCARFAQGISVGDPAGDDKGRGTLNATNLFVNNSPVLKQSDIFVSADQVITTAGLLTLAHGLGAAPRLVQPAFVCQTAELGYSIGDVTFPYTAVVSCVPDATNLVIRYLSGAPSVVNKTTGAYTAITPANWKARFLAIK